jgi:hypothetical protein
MKIKAKEQSEQAETTVADAISTEALSDTDNNINKTSNLTIKQKKDKAMFKKLVAEQMKTLQRFADMSPEDEIAEIAAITGVDEELPLIAEGAGIIEDVAKGDLTEEVKIILPQLQSILDSLSSIVGAVDLEEIVDETPLAFSDRIVTEILKLKLRPTIEAEKEVKEQIALNDSANKKAIATENVEKAFKAGLFSEAQKDGALQLATHNLQAFNDLYPVEKAMEAGVAVVPSVDAVNDVAEKSIQLEGKVAFSDDEIEAAKAFGTLDRMEEINKL